MQPADGRLGGERRLASGAGGAAAVRMQEAEVGQEPAREEPGPEPERREEPANEPVRPAPAGRKRRRAILIIGGLAALAVLGILLYVLLTAGKERTDDAFVDADVVALALRVGGSVRAVPVVENAPVRQGEVLFELDDRDYRARLARARAERDSARSQTEAADAAADVAVASARGSFAEAEAGLRGSDRAVAAAQAQLEQARANLRSRQADLTLAEADLRRAQMLIQARAIPPQQLDQAVARRGAQAAATRAAEASVGAAEEALRRAQAAVSESQGRVAASRPVDARITNARANAAYQRARLESAEAALTLATLELEWTRLTAPGDGVVSAITSHPGSFVAPGQTVAQFVPARKYVTANFKETQVGKMRVGQRAEVSVDTYGRTLHGQVVSLAGGTGARFSLFPPDNATGNFVKIAQRIPVRIALDDVPADLPLRAGQSVEVTVHVGG